MSNTDLGTKFFIPLAKGEFYIRFYLSVGRVGHDMDYRIYVNTEKGV